MIIDTLDQIVLDHGSGGLLSRDLVVNTIAPELGEAHIGKMQDSCILPVASGQIAVTTDSFVIDPPIFVNGDIGKVAVCGTVNDLAVSGAIPQYLTLALILEEGFPLRQLRSILGSIRDVALEANVKIVAGDTKVVRKGEVDKIFINTAGVGVIPDGRVQPDTRNIRTGDRVIVTGWLGNHSIHIMSLRHGLGYENKILSDCAPLNHLISDVLSRHGEDVRFIRDITRGGLGTLLNEVAEEILADLAVSEVKLPIQHEVRMASEMLGISPLYLANEGNLCMIVASDACDAILGTLRAHPHGKHASVIGEVKSTRTGRVKMTAADGEESIIEHLIGAELPRLC